MVFIVLRDVTETIQCVIKKDKASKAAWESAEKITTESSIEVSGEIRADKRAPTGYEIEVKEMRVVGLAEPFPITKDKSPEFLLDKRHLWLRARKLTAVMKIRSTITGRIHKF